MWPWYYFSLFNVALLARKEFDLQENEPLGETHCNSNGLARFDTEAKANLEITNLHEPVLKSFNI